MEYVCCMDVNYANHWLSEICFRKVSVLGCYALLTGNLLKVVGSHHLHNHSQAEWISLLVLPGSEDMAAKIFQSVGN